MNQQQYHLSLSPVAGEVIEDWTLSGPEIHLLFRALREWDDHARFTNKNVRQTQAIFRKVFNDTPRKLYGSTIRDAILLHAKIPTEVAYCAVIKGMQVAFVRLPFPMSKFSKQYLPTSFALMCQISAHSDAEAVVE